VPLINKENGVDPDNCFAN